MNGRDYISPRQLAAAIGVSESSLKRWTDQGLLPAVKTAGGHRRLSVAGVVHFLRTTKTPLVNPEILELTCRLAPGLTDIASARATYYEALSRGDRPACSAAAVRCYLSGHSVAVLCDQVLQPALSATGDAWQRGEVDVYQEHRATQICRAILNELRGLIPVPSHDARRAVGGAAPGDPYAIPTAMVELCLAELGWHAVDFGPDTPIEALGRAAEAERPNLVWLSVSVYENPATFVRHLSDLVRRCADLGIQLAVGGRALVGEVREAVPVELVGRLMHDLERLTRRRASAALNDASDVIGL